jgi:hypothetical protein
VRIVHLAAPVFRALANGDLAAANALASQYGFTEAGEQWDDEDGLEIIYEVGA